MGGTKELYLRVRGMWQCEVVIKWLILGNLRGHIADNSKRKVKGKYCLFKNFTSETSFYRRKKIKIYANVVNSVATWQIRMTCTLRICGIT